MNNTMEKNTISRIQVSVIGNRFDAISKEIGLTMLRTSRSPIFSEARDFVTGIFDKDLRLVAQTAFIPLLMGALPFALRSIAKEFAGDIDDGDIFILNDPYRGNNHPPDITIAKPVFIEGKLQFWSVSKGHHADVGGGGVVGYNPSARSIWEECLRIPPAKIMIKGKPNRTLWDMILLNVQLAYLVEGDLNCQIGACTVGDRSLKALADKYGMDLLNQAVEEILNASERQIRAAIKEVPNGICKAERFIDHDGINKDQLIRINLSLTVEDDAIHFDWSESDPQVAGYVNSTLANTVSTSYQALFMSICPDVAYNEGALRALSVTAPEGTVLNARAPAPVTACTVITSQAIIETAWLALAKLAPEKVDAGWSRWCAPATTGINPRTNSPFGDIHFMAKGGAGASKGFDGWDHLGPVICAGGLRSPDPELHELVNPYRILKYEYWPDSAGAGEWRGGMGTIYHWEVEAEGIRSATFGGGIKEETKPFGLEGGHPAPPTEIYIRRNGKVETIDTESFYSLQEKDIFEIFETGGGGYGNPANRDPQRVQQDVLDGLVSVQQAREKYQVVVNPEDLSLDRDATQVLRSSQVSL